MNSPLLPMLLSGDVRLATTVLLMSIVLLLASPFCVLSVSRDQRHTTVSLKAQSSKSSTNLLAELHLPQVVNTEPPDDAIASTLSSELPLPEPFTDPSLPASLEPEVAHFDVLYGIHPRKILAEDARHVISHGPPVNTIKYWQAIGNSNRPAGPMLQFSKGCRVHDGDWPPTTMSISFDGRRCFGYMQNGLPATWGSKPDSAFTAVWIGRFNSSHVDDQVLVTLSSQPKPEDSDIDNELFWGRKSTFTYSKEKGFGFQISDADLGSTPENVWTMEVLVRHGGATAASYHRYTTSYYALRTRHLSSRPTSIDPDTLIIGMDFQTKDKYFHGDLAVLLLYNRALSEAELAQLAGHYAARFKWNLPAATPPPPPKQLGAGDFLGCYKDMAYRALPQLVAEFDDMTVDTCRQHAINNGYQYYGLEAGRQCFAGWDLERAQSHGPSTGCTWRCAGADLQTCGGDWAISIYTTGISMSSQFNTPPYNEYQPTNNPQEFPPSFLGCFADPALLTLLELLEVSESMTIDMCKQWAMSYPGLEYFGVSAGRKCYGSPDLQQRVLSPAASADYCDWPCPGNTSQMCGGIWTISIYSISSSNEQASVISNNLDSIYNTDRNI